MDSGVGFEDNISYFTDGQSGNRADLSKIQGFVKIYGVTVTLGIFRASAGPMQFGQLKEVSTVSSSFSFQASLAASWGHIYLVGPEFEVADSIFK